MGFIISAQEKDEVLLKFDDENIKRSEFKRVYLKNNNGEIVSKSTIDEYLELYINFKLKVKEAESRGMDTITSFVQELSGYRKQLAQPYLTEAGIYEDLKKEAYGRLQEDIKASHILIAVEEEASPDDTLAAYKKIAKIKKQIEKGEDFSDMARRYSDDPSAKTNKGNLGYFTAFYMLYSFETAAYNTPKGKISEIIRTQYGYHILKVFDKRPAVGNIKVAHILISNDPEFSKTQDPKGKIDEIYKKLQEGASFEDMAKQFSDDTRSSDKGGELATFGVGRMVPAFEEASFGLKKDGEISKPFSTPYGWHIVKRLKQHPIGAFKEVEEEMMTRIKKDSRSNLSQGAVIKKIKKQYGFKENLKRKQDFYSKIDSSYFMGAWKKEKANDLKSVLFKIGDKEVYQSDFASYLEEKSKGSKTKVVDNRVVIDSRYNNFKSETLLLYKNDKLESEFPEFANLMREYHDGILLFNLTDELVWSKAVKDTTGLESFYMANKEKYKWEERVDAIVFSALNQEIADQVKTMLNSGKTLDDIVKTTNQSSQLNLKYEKKKYLKGENKLVDQVNWEKGISDFINIDSRVKFIQINEVIKPTYKTLEDSRGLITSDYQNHLEEEWIKSLRSKYKYEVDKKVLGSLKKELE